MMDQYKEQYKKETEQIHAPADLIARTKAAVREEEARIQKEREVRTVKPGMQEIPAAQKKHSPGMTARKWAYPLTAVAAILVLVSVSMMMRGLGKTASDGASYESAAATDSGGAESAAEEGFEEAVPEAAFVLEEAPEEAPETAAGGVAPAVAAAADEAASDEEAAVAAENEASTTSGVAELEDETKRAADDAGAASESGTIENAMSQKQEDKLADEAAVMESVTITKVLKKPAFVNRADIELQTYEDTVFQIAEDGDGWIAYVESESGGGYVLRGEAETLEAFLEAGYRRLSEISF